MCSRVNYYERKVQADTGYHEQPLTTLPLSNTITLPEADTSRCYSHKPNIRYPLPFQNTILEGENGLLGPFLKVSQQQYLHISLN